MTITMIEELKRLEAEATPGDWDVSGLTVYDTCMDSVASTHSAADAALIVAMRNALPELLKALEEARAALEEAMPYVARHESENFSNAALNTYTKMDAAIRALPPHGGVDVG